MKKVILGKSNIEVPICGMGVLPIGPCQKNLTLEEGADVILYAYENGITFFDTAEFYETYEYMKYAFDKLEDKKDLVISSKSHARTYDGMMHAIDDALNKLDREFIDIFLMHELRSNQFEEKKEAWQALIDAKKMGKVKAIGVSTHHTDIIKEFSLIPECDIIFGLVNYLGLGVRTGLSEEEIAKLDAHDKKFSMLVHGCLDRQGTIEEAFSAIKLAKENNKGFYVMKAFGGGNLVKDYTKALDFIYDNPNIDSLFIGFGSKKDIDDFISYNNHTMDSNYTPNVKDKKLRVEKLSCEGCGNCIKHCASKAIHFNNEGLAEIDESKCLTCGYCAKACPARAIIFY